MMVRYTLVAWEYFLALSSLGIDLGKFGILAGALGVGLGFGLQKIVANFISSLIIAFGRAIRVGDTVQYQDVLGNVKEIGVNASTVRTFDGSDAIIPNSDLISNKVTNWTLLDMQRRMLLPVKVAFGNNPHEVLKILEKVAQNMKMYLIHRSPSLCLMVLVIIFLTFLSITGFLRVRFLKRKQKSPWECMMPLQQREYRHPVHKEICGYDGRRSHH